MRGNGALFATLGLVAGVAVVIGQDLPAAARGVAFPPPSNTNPASNLSGVSPKDLEAALVTLGTGAQTIGGPGTFSDIVGEGLPVYQVATGPAPDVCITVRNPSTGDVKVVASGAEILVEARRTRTACFGAPTEITLRCDQKSCAAVWRVDHQ
jgi:hypothetical protein